jgi:hypothetical protein
MYIFTHTHIYTHKCYSSPRVMITTQNDGLKCQSFVIFVSHFILSIYCGLECLTEIVKWLTFLSAIFEWVIHLGDE